MIVKVEFKTGKKGDLITRVSGKIAFIDRNSPSPMPKAGELWAVQVTGKNPRGTVYFVQPVEKLHRCDRCAANERIYNWHVFYHTTDEKVACDKQHAESVRLADIANNLQPGQIWVEDDYGLTPGDTYKFGIDWIIRNSAFREVEFVGPNADFALAETKRLRKSKRESFLQEFEADISRFPTFGQGSIKALEWARNQFVKDFIPDKVEYRVDVYGNHKIVAIHQYPGTATDAWGNPVSCDEVAVAVSAIPFDDPDGLCKKWAKRRVKFFHLEKEQEEFYATITRTMERMGMVDVDDCRGTPQLMAYYPIGVKAW